MLYIRNVVTSSNSMPFHPRSEWQTTHALQAILRMPQSYINNASPIRLSRWCDNGRQASEVCWNVLRTDRGDRQLPGCTLAYRVCMPRTRTVETDSCTLAYRRLYAARIINNSTDLSSLHYSYAIVHLFNIRISLTPLQLGIGIDFREFLHNQRMWAIIAFIWK